MDSWDTVLRKEVWIDQIHSPDPISKVLLQIADYSQVVVEGKKPAARK